LKCGGGYEIIQSLIIFFQVRLWGESRSFNHRSSLGQELKKLITTNTGQTFIGTDKMRLNTARGTTVKTSATEMKNKVKKKMFEIT